jgi:CheY-like chemotaxis protein
MAGYVLIVDDREANRRHVRLVLAERGLESKVVASCSDALTALRSGPPPSIIVLAPTVPRAEADELRALTRRHPFLARIPLTILSTPAVVEADGAVSPTLDDDTLIEAVAPVGRIVP